MDSKGDYRQLRGGVDDLPLYHVPTWYLKDTHLSSIGTNEFRLLQHIPFVPSVKKKIFNFFLKF